MTEFPEWWDWELELSAHVLERMIDRSFSEIDLRGMIESCTLLEEDHSAGRWVITTFHDAKQWKVVIEPDSIDRVLVVITAYPTKLP